MDVIGILFDAIWIGVIGYWAVAAFFVKKTARAQPIPAYLIYFLLAILLPTVLELRHIHGTHLMKMLLLPRTEGLRVACLAALAIGAWFAVWARRTLGGNWSGKVMLKENHTLVRTGPYRLVRHPIYSGLLLMIIATAMYQDRLIAMIFMVYVFIGIAIKIRMEESLMTEQFGDEYRKYKREVKAIIPGVV